MSDHDSLRPETGVLTRGFDPTLSVGSARPAVADRRTFAPYGLQGGTEAQKGQAFLNGNELPGKCNVEAKSGSILRIETPGGGGWGVDLASLRLCEKFFSARQFQKSKNIFSRQINNLPPLFPAPRNTLLLT